MSVKNIDIYYHMIKSGEIAEAVITLPVLSEIADDIISNQRGSAWVADEADGTAYISGAVFVVLYNMAQLQGYDRARFILAEYPGVIDFEKKVYGCNHKRGVDDE